VGVPDKVGEAARIFRAIAGAAINIDMIVQNISAAATGRTDISFTLPREDGHTAVTSLRQLQDQVGFESILYDDRIGKVSVVGAGMRSHPGVSATFFGALAEAGVNIEMISTSEIRISVVVDENDVGVAVTAAHKAFDLEAGGEAAVRSASAVIVIPFRVVVLRSGQRQQGMGRDEDQDQQGMGQSGQGQGMSQGQGQSGQGQGQGQSQQGGQGRGRGW